MDHREHGHHPGDPGHDNHAGHECLAGPDVHSGHAGDGDHEGHVGHGDHVAMFRRLFWIMLVIAVPTVLASEMFASILGYDLPDVPGV